MKIHVATQRYERWLGNHVSLVQSTLLLKHAAMKQDPFSFLRATFYRWMQVWPEACPEAAKAPPVLAVGDLHVDNFGTWRDREGRLIWGINDFDEAYPLPYTLDLVRLAVSATFSIHAHHLRMKPSVAHDAILTGYRDGLEAGGNPFVLAEHHPWLHELATHVLRNPVRFWRKLHALPLIKAGIPVAVQTALRRLMPEPGLRYSLHQRVGGMGSLGRPRVVAVAEWHGGSIAREAKALAPSACVWANPAPGPTGILYQSLLDQAVRSRDPFVSLEGQWLIRRLSPYCSRIELTALPNKKDERRLLYAMGWETANVHLGSRRAIKSVRRDLAARKGNWLHTAAKAMVKATVKDWKEWAKD